MSKLAKGTVVLLTVLTGAAGGLQLYYLPIYLWGEPEEIMPAGYAVIFASPLVFLLCGLLIAVIHFSGSHAKPKAFVRLSRAAMVVLVLELCVLALG
jgi:hypothetical protein